MGLEMTPWFLNFDFNGRSRRSHAWANWACWFGASAVLLIAIGVTAGAHPDPTKLNPLVVVLSLAVVAVALLSFVDNHDVTRIASILTNERHLPLVYALLFGMPGIPCVYYGSEWGERAEKQPGGDWNLRPAFDAPQWNALTDRIAALAHVRRASPALCWGDFGDRLLTNRQTIFERRCGEERVLVAVNADEQPYRAYCDFGCARALDLLTGREIDLGGGLELPPYGAAYLRCLG